MLCERRQPRRRALGVAEAQRLHEVRVLRVAVRTGHPVRVVTVEAQTLLRMHQHLEAVIALERQEKDGEWEKLK